MYQQTVRRPNFYVPRRFLPTYRADVQDGGASNLVDGRAYSYLDVERVPICLLEMSGFEVIGVIASASQIIKYTGEIIDYIGSVFDFVTGTSCQFEQHREHLEALISTVKTIRQTPLLQTSLVRVHLEVLSRQTKTLGAVLRRYTIDLPRKSFRRFWTALFVHKAEGQILRGLASLERDKSNLLLCITSSYGIVLHEIKERTNSDLMAPKDDKSAKSHRKPEDSGYQSEEPANPEPRQGPNEGGGTLRLEEHVSLKMTSPDSTSPQNAKVSIVSSHPSTVGNAFLQNNAQNSGTVVNRAGNFENQGKRRDVFGGNGASGQGSTVMNGPLTAEDFKTVFDRSRKP